jgi:hypothetical protein
MARVVGSPARGLRAIAIPGSLRWAPRIKL